MISIFLTALAILFGFGFIVSYFLNRIEEPVSYYKGNVGGKQVKEPFTERDEFLQQMLDNEL
jgi:hypothetical protein